MKVIFTILFIFAFCKFGAAQNFTFERISPEIIQGDTGGTGTDWGSKAIFKNISSNSIRYFIERTFEQFPDNTWSSAICTRAGCYANWVNIVPDTAFEDNLLAPDEQDTVTLYFYGITPGLGTVYLRMYEQGNPSVYIEQVFKAQLGPVGITQISSVVQDYKLDQNFPNPFNPSTTIGFRIARSGFVSLKLFDIMGRVVATLVNETLQEGEYNYLLSTEDYRLPSGVYYYTLSAGDFIQTNKMILQK